MCFIECKFDCEFIYVFIRLNFRVFLGFLRFVLMKVYEAYEEETGR